MSTLLDLATIKKTIPVQGKNIEVRGVSAEAFASILMRFPELAKVFAGMDGDPKELMKMAPPAIGAFIAAGCGLEGDEKAEKIAREIGVADQLDIITEVIKLTFPRGVGPFVAKMEELGVLAQVQKAQSPS